MDASGSWMKTPVSSELITSQAFSAARAAGKLQPQLPKSSGKPYPVAPDCWRPLLACGTGVPPGQNWAERHSAMPPGRPAEFVLREGLEIESQGFAGSVEKCGSGLQLTSWNAVSKHMRGDKPNPLSKMVWPSGGRKAQKMVGGLLSGWQHPRITRVFVELVPELFLMQAILLETEKPGLLRAVTDEWLKGLESAPRPHTASGGQLTVSRWLRCSRQCFDRCV